jgi:hypothetical protein
MLASRWSLVHHLKKPRLAAFSTSSTSHRDLTAKYRYRPPTPSEKLEEYVTASTTPVTSSIQAVPPPAETSPSNLEKAHDTPFVGRKVTPLPAMQPLHQEEPKKVKPRAEELRVAGVVVPPKPSPPESDGKYTIILEGSLGR